MQRRVLHEGFGHFLPLEWMPPADSAVQLSVAGQAMADTDFLCSFLECLKFLLVFWSPINLCVSLDPLPEVEVSVRNLR